MRGARLGAALLVLSACGVGQISGPLGARPGAPSASAASDGGEALTPSSADASAPARDAGSMADAAPSVSPPSPDASAPADASAPPRCGDSVCAAPDTCESCPADCGACGWPEPLARSEEDLLARINELRAMGATCGNRAMPPAPPLAMSPELREAARLHSADMGAQDYFDHASLDGRSFSQRARDAGYNGAPMGENIAAGSAGADGTFGQWHRSPGHCLNMMNAGGNEVGIGHAYDERGRYGHYWTLVLGVR